MKKILITGAGSYIGTSFENYVKQWPDKYQVDTLDMIGDGWKNYDFSGYDSVFHVAGIAHIKETAENAALYYLVNRDIPYETAQKAKAAGVKQFVFLSSMSVYGLDTGVIDAETPLCPKNNYGKSKVEAENLVNALQNASFAVVIIRPPMVYGKGCKGNYQILRKLALKLPCFPKVNNQRSMIYIDNLTEFVRLLIEDQAQGIFFPQNLQYMVTTHMVELIAQANNKKLLIIPGVAWAIKLLRPITAMVDKAFGSLIYTQELSHYDTDYQVCDWEESIARTENTRE